MRQAVELRHVASMLTGATCPNATLDPHMEGSNPHIGGVRGLKSPGFEGPRAVWSVWVVLLFSVPWKSKTMFNMVDLVLQCKNLSLSIK